MSAALPSYLQIKDEGVVISLAVSPGAKKSEIIGPTPDGFLKVKIAAPPHEGKANQELIEIPVRPARLRKSAIQIISGETARKKRVLAKGADPQSIIWKLKV